MLVGMSRTQSDPTAKKGRRLAVTFTEEQEMQIVDFLLDNELDKNPMTSKALFDEFFTYKPGFTYCIS